MNARIVFALLLGATTSAQTVTVPVGTELVVRTKAPVDASLGGKRFAAVLVEDVITDFMGVAAAGEVCSGLVVEGPRGSRTLVLDQVRTPFATHRISAGDPLYGAGPPPQHQVVGFAGSLPAAPRAAEDLTGRPVLLDASRTGLAAGTTLEFRLTSAWELPVREAESVFPQPEGAEPYAGPREVPASWFAQVDRNAAQQQQQQQRQAMASEQARARRRWYRQSRWRNSRWGASFAHPEATRTPSLSQSELRAMRGEPVTLPAGTAVVARLDERIDSSEVEPGAPFEGILMTDLVADGRIAVPRGSRVHGVITVGKLGEILAPTLALRMLQVGGLRCNIRTGASQILHRPARATPTSAVGVGSIADLPADAPWSEDGTLRLPAGTIVAFELAEPLTMR